MQQQPQRDNWNVGLAQSLGLTYNIAYALCIGVLPFIRTRFGPRAFDPHIVVTLLLLLLLAGSYPVFLPYFACWLLMVVVHRVRSWKSTNHSQYQGFPWLGMRMPFAKTENDGRLAEPFICGVVALLMAEVTPQLAALIGVCAAALVVKAVLDELIDRRRLQGMRDAEIEMRYYTEKFRGRQ